MTRTCVSATNNVIRNGSQDHADPPEVDGGDKGTFQWQRSVDFEIHCCAGVTLLCTVLSFLLNGAHGIRMTKRLVVVVARKRTSEVGSGRRWRGGFHSKEEDS